MSAKTYIILLRGVTPTGKNKVPMALLRAALEKVGLKDVRTYIQSGNVIASSDLDQTALEKRVHNVIKKSFGGELTVVARPVPQFRRIVEGNPFKNADTSRLYFTLFAAKPETKLVKEFLAADWTPDKIAVIGDAAYLLFATKYSDSKLNNNFIERKLKVAATTRIYNTMAKLVSLATE